MLKPRANPYTWTGWGLLLAGALTAVTSYVILNIAWLTALGMAMVIISFILLALAKSVPVLSPALSHLLFETATENLAVLLEELALYTKAVYLPPSLTDDKSHALVPLAVSPRAEMLGRPLPNRLIVRYGKGPQDIGLLVTTPGTVAVKVLGERMEANTEQLGAELSAFFRGTLGIADSVSVSSENDRIRVTFSHLHHERANDRTDLVLGSAPASVAAALTAAAWDRPVTIFSEGGNARKYDVVIELLK